VYVYLHSCIYSNRWTYTDGSGDDVDDDDDDDNNNNNKNTTL
jgi:hypothetical protein